ncbi:MAG: DMT family transporter [Armatimonadota bacterium]|nr:DMT family transporter [Armatimonadota bacterium]MDR7550104.1 DMT family transporter [Armatimonadota bacterium]
MLLLVLLWGVNFSIVKVAFAEIPPFGFNGLRFAIAAVCLLAVLRRLEHAWWVDRGDLRGLALLGLLGHVGYQTFFIAGLAHTTVGHSALILSMVPLFVGALGAVLGIERPSARMWVGLALAFAGVFILIRGRAALALGQSTALGDLLTLGASMCWAAYTVLSRPFLTRFSPLRLTTVTLVLALPVLLALALPGLSRLRWTDVTPQAWAALAFSSIFAIVIGYVIWYTSVQTMGSARTAAFSNLIPVVALLAASVLLGEPLGPAQVLGAAVVLAAVWLARTGRPAVQV